MEGRTSYSTLENYLHYPDSFRPIDTSLHNFLLYDPFYLTNLGNPGLPVQPLIFNQARPVGFNLGIQGWSPYFRHADQVAFYSTNRPYTRFYYVQGAQGFQLIEATHAQNLRPNLSFAVDHQSFHSNGRFSRQVALQGHTSLSLYYSTPGKRYALILTGLTDNMRAQANGGVVSDTLFERKVGFNKYLTPVNLNFANQTLNRRQLSATQFLFLGRKEMVTFHDSDTVSLPIVRPRYFMAYTVSFEDSRYYFKDSTASDLAFYPSVFLDPLLTREWIRSSQFSNRLTLGRGMAKLPSDSVYAKEKWTIGAFAQHDLISAKQLLLDTAFSNISVGGYLRSGSLAGSGVAHKIQLDISGVYFLNGYNASDYAGQGRIGAAKSMGKTILVAGAFADLRRAAPAWIENRIFNNNFRWNNDFEKEQSISGGGQVTFIRPKNKLSLSLGIRTTSNIIYFDTLAQARQSSIHVNYLIGKVVHQYATTHFVLQHNLTLQQANSTLVRFPGLILRTSYFFQDHLFKKALYFRLGVDGWYTSAYNSYSYMPVHSVFHLQDSFTIGNYPYLDAWVAGQVKRFAFFAKIENLSEGFFSEKAYALSLMPIQPRTFRLGIRWMFFD